MSSEAMSIAFDAIAVTDIPSGGLRMTTTDVPSDAGALPLSQLAVSKKSTVPDSLQSKTQSVAGRNTARRTTGASTATVMFVE